MKALKQGEFKKTYLARVKGDFPVQLKCEAPLLTLHRTAIVSEQGKPSITLFRKWRNPSRQDSSIVNDGVNSNHEDSMIGNGEDSKISNVGMNSNHEYSKFVNDGVNWSDGNDGGDQVSSLVECQPLTGRMHQIRAHLQYLRYPILNDPIYGLGKKQQMPIREIPSHVDCLDCYLPLPDPEQTCIYLHSYQYAFQGKIVTAPLPEWCRF